MKTAMSMRSWRRWAAACLMLALAACETTSSGSAGQPGADPRLANSSQARFFSKSGLQACAGGALAGILACELSNTRDKGRCRLAAGVAGCGVGIGANYYLDHQRAQYARAEDRLDATIADVRQDNQQLQALSDTARSVIEDDKRKIARIRQDIAANTLQREQAQKQLTEIDANTAYLNKTLADVRAKQQQWQEVADAERRSGAKVDGLDAEINRMQKQVASLELEIDQLYQQRSAIQLG